MPKNKMTVNFGELGSSPADRWGLASEEQRSVLRTKPYTIVPPLFLCAENNPFWMPVSEHGGHSHSS